MPNLKDLKTRINSVKSTQKITSAMKMVAAAKLRKAQESAESGRPFAEKMQSVISNLALNANSESASPLLIGKKNNNKHLIVMVSADKGLCGGFNSSIARYTRDYIGNLEKAGKQYLVYVIGRKAGDVLTQKISNNIFDKEEGIQGNFLKFSDVETVSKKILTAFSDEKFGSVSIIFNSFVNAITQKVTLKKLIPAEINENKSSVENKDIERFYDYEPDEKDILDELLPQNITTQIYSALLESSAAELAARMTAMDNATRNAGDMIDNLTLVYNRTRQANITKELIEIISGAEAL